MRVKVCPYTKGKYSRSVLYWQSYFSSFHFWDFGLLTTKKPIDKSLNDWRPKKTKWRRNFVFVCDCIWVREDEMLNVKKKKRIGRLCLYTLLFLSNTANRSLETHTASPLPRFGSMFVSLRPSFGRVWSS
jgi:hypothetical protein